MELVKYLARSARRLRQLLRKQTASAGNGMVDVKLHLGCGGEYWPGWVNVDSDPDSICDLRIDFTEIGEHYPAGSVAMIVMVHSISYLRLWQARELFADLYQMLKPGGTLVLELPDISKCAKHMLENEMKISEYLEGVRGLYAFDLEWNSSRKAYPPYAFGWSGWHLKQELEQASFQNVIVLAPQFHGPRPWRDIRVEATK